ncbi:hypothetical protein [Streptomyces sp. 7N604]|uniref:hypothetical protein n=1 Tax=Streptomyces sp. 7N604 TaxID=3457415 RepID=UPI003FD3C626
MTPLPVVAVLASAPVVYRVTDGLRSVGCSVLSWVLPDQYSAVDAAALAAEAGDWADMLSESQVVVTAFDDPAILEAVVAPFVLPALPEDLLWLQMGPQTAEQAQALDTLADEAGVTVVHAPLHWSADRTAAYGPLPAELIPGAPYLQADADLVYGLTLTALLKPGLGLTPPAPIPASLAEDLAQWETELTAIQARTSPISFARVGPQSGLQPLSETAIAELQARGLVDPSTLPGNGSTGGRRSRQT